MDTIYDTIAKLNKVANAPEIVKEDNQALMKKGLEDLMKKTKLNKQSDYKPFGKGDKDYETGLPKDAKKDKMFDDMKAADAAKMNKQSTYKPFGKDDPDYETGLPKNPKEAGKLREKESDVERDDRAEKAGREVKRDAKYDGMKHAGKDGKSVTKDIEYDEKHDKDGMHEADMKMVKGPDGKMVPSFAADGKGKNDLKKEDQVAEISNKKIDSYLDKVGQEDGHEQDMETASSKRGKGIDLATAKQLGTAKVKATENAGTLKDAARQGVLARLAELAGIPAQEIEEALGTPQDIASKIMAETDLNERMSRDELDIDDEDNLMSAEELKKELIDDLNHLYDVASKDDFTDTDHIVDEMGDYFNDMHVNADDETLEIYGMARDLAEADPAEVVQMAERYIKALGGIIESKDKVDEAEVEEGNEFSGERDKAIKAGKDSFEVDGKTYPVKGDKNESIEEDEEKIDESYHKNMVQDVEEGMSKKDFAEKYPGSKDDYDDIKKEIEDRMDEEKVEETTSGSVATSEDSAKPAFPNASIYEKYQGNEIAQRAFQINEDMSISVHAGTDAEPSVNINASGEDAAKMMELCKLAGIGGMGGMGMGSQSPYGEVEIAVSEDQEFANSADDQNTMDTEYMTQDIAGGLNGPKKMAYPKVAGGDNPMAVLGESELNEVSADHLMKKYEAFKAK